jgi:hypothetical protein
MVNEETRDQSLEARPRRVNPTSQQKLVIRVTGKNIASESSKEHTAWSMEKSLSLTESQRNAEKEI